MSQSRREKNAFHNLGLAGHNYSGAIDRWERMLFDTKRRWPKILLSEAKKIYLVRQRELKRAAREFVRAEKITGGSRNVKARNDQD